jgi:hypothetical protein
MSPQDNENNPPKNKDVTSLLDDLEDSLFTTEDEKGEAPPPQDAGEDYPPIMTLPLLIDEKTATNICDDVLKRRNQRKHKYIGIELLFKPYWFFTYTCELVIRDQDGNIVDSDEVGGRMAVDAINGSLADYLTDLLKTEPVELVPFEQELEQYGQGAKVLDPKIREDELKEFVKQKISGVLRADKDYVSVAGFELAFAPVWRVWFEIKKRTHNVQIDGAGGVGINMDDIPLKQKTWVDVVANDIDKLKNPKKWKEFLSGKATAAIAVGKKGKNQGLPNEGNNKYLLLLIAGVVFFYGLSVQDNLILFAGILALGLIVWYFFMRKSNKPPAPPAGYPPQGYAQQPYPPAGYPPNYPPP